MITPESSESLRTIVRREAAWRDLTVRWSAINSGSDHASGLARMLAELEAAFGVFPASAERLMPAAGALAPSLSVRCRPEAPVRVLLNGHYDTVFGADDPFKTPRLVSPDVLNGPGVADMKGGIVVMLAALTALERHPAAGRIGWEVLLTSDEESGSHGSRAHLAAAAGRNHLGLVFEPSPEGDDVVRTRKGTASLFVEARGRAAHSSLARTEGRNAIVALAEFLGAAHRLNDEIDGLILNVASIAGGGAANIVPDRARAELHLRLARAADGDRALARLREFAAAINGREGFHLGISGGINRPPMETTFADDRWCAELQACGQALGQRIARRDVGSASDANFLAAAGLPVIDGLGVDGDALHCDREFCRLGSLARRAQLTALLLMRLAEGAFAPPPRSAPFPP